MKKVILCAIALIIASASMFAQEDLKAKANADLQKMVGAWTFSLENPQGGPSIDGVATFTKDDKGVKCVITGYGSDLKSSYFTPREDGRSLASIPIDEYGIDIYLFVKLDAKGNIVSYMDIGGMMDASCIMYPKKTE